MTCLEYIFLGFTHLLPFLNYTDSSRSDNDDIFLAARSLRNLLEANFRFNFSLRRLNLKYLLLRSLSSSLLNHLIENKRTVPVPLHLCILHLKYPLRSDMVHHFLSPMQHKFSLWFLTRLLLKFHLSRFHTFCRIKFFVSLA